MNQFKVGDEVWTGKRGWGIIVRESDVEAKRPFCVCFDGLHYFPKLSNLVSNKSIAEANYITINKIMQAPKFKKGDKVFHDGKKWEIGSEMTQNRTYQINRMGEGGIYIVSRCSESDLRLWKEHEFRYISATQSSKPTIIEVGDFACPADFQKAKHVGKTNGFDIFLFHNHTGNEIILFGTKGDTE